MKKKIFLSLLVVLGLFIMTGCTKEEQKQLNDELNKYDNVYIHSSDGGSNNNNNQQTDDKQQDDTSNTNMNEKLVGTWKYTVPDSSDGTEEDPGDIYTYTFRSNGTAEFTHFKAWNLVTDEYSFSSYEYDGKKIRLVEELSFGGANVIEHEITLSGSGFREKDTGRTYYKK